MRLKLKETASETVMYWLSNNTFVFYSHYLPAYVIPVLCETKYKKEKGKGK
jgi:hypothetical protein